MSISRFRPLVTGHALRFLELVETGPAKSMRYTPSERLNVITGDNGLGKTFILDCAWWALTEGWLGDPALPHSNVPKATPKLSFGINMSPEETQNYSFDYDWDQQEWKYFTKNKNNTTKSNVMSGLVVYARIDGSFAVWDSAGSISRETGVRNRSHNPIILQNNDVWDGLKVEGTTRRSQWVCNGLLRDWVTWQTGGERHTMQYNALAACLKTLSPSEDEPLEPGEPTRLPFDALEIPTLKMPYGDVPVIYASAGIKRIIALAYILVWTWHEHLANSKLIRREPHRNLVLMVDEVEAHLHPFWQRMFIPALMQAVSQLMPDVTPQLHLATHSPMVMASTETVFDAQTDALHHLKLKEREVVLEELPFVKRGRADLWLMSDVFGLRQPRSVEAEKAIEEAKALQLADGPSAEAVHSVNSRLVRCLAPDDDFWPRWRYFALQHGLPK